MIEPDRPSGPVSPDLAVRDVPPPKAKRLYAMVSVGSESGHFRVLLDGRPLKTPLRRALETPCRALADAIAEEWRVQGEEIDPLTMPLTRLTSTAIDRVATERPAMVTSLLAYIETDLLCYRAPHPAELKARQAATWQPILDWLAAEHGIGLDVVHGILPVNQSPSAVSAAERALAALTLEEFTGLQAAAAATGSIALALALLHGRVNSTEAFAAAQLDESYQNEHWGEDAEALERRRRIAAEVEAVGRYFALVRSG